MGCLCRPAQNADSTEADSTDRTETEPARNVIGRNRVMLERQGVNTHLNAPNTKCSAFMALTVA